MDLTRSPEIDTTRCDGCGQCLPACASGALGLDGGKAVLVRPELCQWDSACELACPRSAIRVPYFVVFRDEPHRPGTR